MRLGNIPVFKTEQSCHLVPSEKGDSFVVFKNALLSMFLESQRPRLSKAEVGVEN